MSTTESKVYSVAREVLKLDDKIAWYGDKMVGNKRAKNKKQKFSTLQQAFPRTLEGRLILTP